MISVADPRASYLAVRDEVDEAIARVLQSGHYILGPETHQLESEFADYLGSGEVVAVGNATDGIALALRALGVGSGDEVIAPSHTAVATVAGIEMAGASPVLADVDPVTLTLDYRRVQELVSDRTAAVMPVHLYGQPADLDAAVEFHDRTGIPLVEDASQAHGALWRGRRVGTFGQAAVFSCYPTKNLGGLGDGGLVATPDSQTSARIRRIRQYGWETRNLSREPGVNSRMDELQAAVLRVQLRYLDAPNARRRELARNYREALGDIPIGLPETQVHSDHVFHLFVIQFDERDALMAHLGSEGIQTAIHYPTPVHMQPAYQGRLRIGSMSTTNRLTTRILSLPLHPQLSDDDIGLVADAIRGFVCDSRDRVMRTR